MGTTLRRHSSHSGILDKRAVYRSQSWFPRKRHCVSQGHGGYSRYGEPCPICGGKIQRIRYADNETNYCARCQTQGKVLADRSLSRLLGWDWPRTLEELEALKKR